MGASVDSRLRGNDALGTDGRKRPCYAGVTRAVRGLAHQTFCDRSGRARLSLWCLVAINIRLPETACESIAFVGLVPTERNGFGVLRRRSDDTSCLLCPVVHAWIVVA
jgi:hypothetical protein